MIVVSLVIGMGIFATPSEVAIKAGNVWIFFGAWVFGGLEEAGYLIKDLEQALNIL
jgi:hypothetical protein